MKRPSKSSKIKNYKIEFLAKIKKSEQEFEFGKTKSIKTEDLWK